MFSTIQVVQGIFETVDGARVSIYSTIFERLTREAGEAFNDF